MKVSTFESPAYGVRRINIDDLVSQKANPNQMIGKAWEALQTSIFNSGYTFPVIAATNTEYDPETEGTQKPSLVEHKDNKEDAVTNTEAGMQVADEDVAKFFKYRLIDGAHRSQIIRLGKYYFDNGNDDSDNWAEGKNIPEKPGPTMLAYLAWRENFTIPCVIRDIDATQQMSEEILHNPICENQIVKVIRKDKNGNPVETEILWKDLQLGDVFAEDYNNPYVLNFHDNESIVLNSTKVSILARWNDDGTWTKDSNCTITVPLHEVKTQISCGKVVTWSGYINDIKIDEPKDIFEISGGPSIVMGIDDWEEMPCITFLNEDNKELEVSKNHLLKVDNDVINKYPWAIEASKESKKQVEEYKNNWITATCLYDILAEEFNEEIGFKIPSLSKIKSIPESDGVIKKCRCITTSSGTYTINGFINHNTARGSHSLDSMKDIVYNLINVAGMSEEWVSQNLYLDLESIKRMQQLSGLKASMTDIDACDMAWTPEKDQSYQRKMTAYLIREASTYIEKYKKENPDVDIPSTGTAVDIALQIGFDQTEVWKQHGELYREVTYK